ncbi:Taf12L [Drosophila busckii]|uniref:Transcription initiation factor TFIID subunit 12 n=1 Tax=Drosophila busckii TaxID=30019 RepID=A0A0M5J3C7_DROBS|nr:uncharacterized protein LOC108608502 [Drosophila busckii]ALC38128.1 Taf12L [Drosophila busckii]ALC38131.1 Taf12L [Drosophila busckii]
MNARPWIDELPKNNSDVSSGNESASSACSLSSSGRSNQNESDQEFIYASGNSYNLISRPNLNRFVHRIDKTATVDEQAADLAVKCAEAFVKDVVMRSVKLAKYRNSVPDVLDLKFTLKREYNMEFPNKN